MHSRTRDDSKMPRLPTRRPHHAARVSGRGVPADHARRELPIQKVIETPRLSGGVERDALNVAVMGGGPVPSADGATLRAEEITGLASVEAHPPRTVGRG